MLSCRLLSLVHHRIASFLDPQQRFFTCSSPLFTTRLPHSLFCNNAFLHDTLLCEQPDCIIPCSEAHLDNRLLSFVHHQIASLLVLKQCFLTCSSPCSPPDCLIAYSETMLSYMLLSFVHHQTASFLVLQQCFLT